MQNRGRIVISKTKKCVILNVSRIVQLYSPGYSLVKECTLHRISGHTGIRDQVALILSRWCVHEEWVRLNFACDPCWVSGLNNSFGTGHRGRERCVCGCMRAYVCDLPALLKPHPRKKPLTSGASPIRGLWSAVKDSVGEKSVKIHY